MKQAFANNNLNFNAHTQKRYHLFITDFKLKIADQHFLSNKYGPIHHLRPLFL